MADEKIERILPESDGAEYRSLGTDLAQAFVAGAAGGAGSEIVKQTVSAIRRPKSTQQPQQEPKKE
jgi:hypothetical protein